MRTGQRRAARLRLRTVLLAVCFPALAQAAGVEDLMELSLESLMDVRVTTASKTPQALAETAASVYVVSREDIRRSGATTLPDALRLVPGMEVINVDGNKAAVALRGFNSGASSNKLLVMIDGRVIYTALLSGVFWQHQDVLMADIDRIEVIRGPGATMWGANAVNGVINIITRDAADTTGGLVEGIAGTDPIGTQGAVRYGAELGDSAHYRIYGKYRNQGEFETASGRSARDDLRMAQAGGRVDWRPGARDHITFQGDVYDGSFHQHVLEQPLVFDPFTFEWLSGIFREQGEMRGGNGLVRWQRELDSGQHAAVQFYYDRFERDDSLAPHSTDTWDLDFQHSFAAGTRLDVLWGLGYRRVEYDFEPITHIQLSPSSGATDLYSSFIQGQYRLRDDLHLTLGSKFEHNSFTGFEVQPSARVLWQASEDHSFWSAVSRAVRTPALFDVFGRTDLFVTAGQPPNILFSVFGNREVEAEELIAYEAGYRSQLRDNLSLDVSLFYNRYDNLINFEPQQEITFEPPNLLFSFSAENRAQATARGLEISSEWQAHEHLRLKGGYSLTQVSARTDRDSQDLFTKTAIETAGPQQQFQIRSYLDLPHDLEFDVALHWVDRLPGDQEMFFQPVDDYLRADLRLGWQPRPDLSLELFLHNALDNRRREFRDTNVISSEVPRTIFARLRMTW